MAIYLLLWLTCYFLTSTDVKQTSTPCQENKDSASHSDEPQSHGEATSSYEPTLELRVKEEKPDLDLDSGAIPGTDSQLGFEDVGEGPDGFLLAQSKLLEDWRPEALNLPRCDANALSQGSGHYAVKAEQNCQGYHTPGPGAKSGLWGHFIRPRDRVATLQW